MEKSGPIFTTFKDGRDNAYPGHPNGGNDTASGVPGDERYSTFAIPGKWRGHPGNDKRTNLKLGDIVLFKNKAPDGKTYQAIGWATDFGGMPHGDIDVHKGALEKGLGLTCVTNSKPVFDKYSNQWIPAGEYAMDTKGQGAASAERVAHMDAKGFKNPRVVQEAILKVNKKLASGEITTDQIRAELAKQVHDPENLKLADEESKKVIIDPRAGGYESYEEARKNGHLKRLSGDDLMDNIMEKMQEDPMMGLLLLFAAFFTGALNKTQVENSPHIPEPVKKAVKEIPDQVIEQGKHDVKKGESPAKAAEKAVDKLEKHDPKVIDDLVKALKSGKVAVNNDVKLDKLSPAVQQKVAELAEKYNQKTGGSLFITLVSGADKLSVVQTKTDLNNDPTGLKSTADLKQICKDLHLSYDDSSLNHINIGVPAATLSQNTQHTNGTRPSRQNQPA